MDLSDEIKIRLEAETSGKATVEPSKPYTVQGVTAIQHSIDIQVGHVVKTAVFIEKEGADPEPHIQTLIIRVKRAINRELERGLRKYA